MASFPGLQSKSNITIMLCYGTNMVFHTRIHSITCLSWQSSSIKLSSYYDHWIKDHYHVIVTVNFIYNIVWATIIQSTSLISIEMVVHDFSKERFLGRTYPKFSGITFYKMDHFPSGSQKMTKVQKWPKSKNDEKADSTIWRPCCLKGLTSLPYNSVPCKRLMIFWQKIATF